MRRILGACVILAIVGSMSIAAEPTPAEAVALIEKLKGVTRPKGSEKLTMVDLSRKKVTDADLKVISSIKTVTELLLGGTLADKNARGALAATGVTDEGLKSIAQMPNLRKLQLEGANITDAGLKHLSGLKNLTDLILNNTKVTDAGMEAVSQIPKLQNLTLFGTKVTETGVGTLKRAKPDLKISK